MIIMFTGYEKIGVNASPAMLPLPAHDSGLMWVANPSS
jgi:hypothetical protein